MTSISFNLSGKIDPILVDALRVIHQEASLLGIRFFVVGATARDLLLSHCHVIRSARMTADLDIGVEVADWEQFRQLSEALVATGRFFRTKELHRLKFDFFPVDIVPYGGVSLDFRSISWPPEHQVIMNIMGFQEAYDSSVTVRLDDAPILDVKLPTIPGMTLMKLIAWNDQCPGRPKDAEDLLFLMENYAEAGNLDRLYGPESDLLQEEGYDQALAGIRLLGRDMGAMVAAATGQAVMAILEAETGTQQRYRLVIDMVRSLRTRDRSDEGLAKLGKLAEGFFETFQS